MSSSESNDFMERFRSESRASIYSDESSDEPRAEGDPVPVSEPPQPHHCTNSRNSIYSAESSDGEHDNKAPTTSKTTTTTTSSSTTTTTPSFFQQLVASEPIKFTTLEEELQKKAASRRTSQEPSGSQGDSQSRQLSDGSESGSQSQDGLEQRRKPTPEELKEIMERNKQKALALRAAKLANKTTTTAATTKPTTSCVIIPVPATITPPPVVVVTPTKTTTPATTKTTTTATTADISSSDSNSNAESAAPKPPVVVKLVPVPAVPTKKARLDTGGGFLLDEDSCSSSDDKPHVTHEPGAILEDVEKHRCEECCREFKESYLLSKFNKSVCDGCKEMNSKHKLITKTDAKTKYQLKDCDFDKRDPPLSYVVRKNPRHEKWGEMKLYLESQVAERALEVLGGEEGIELAKKKKQERREKIAQKKFDKNVNALRLAIQATQPTKSHKVHKHEFGAETYNEEDELYTKSCTVCGHTVSFEKM